MCARMWRNIEHCRWEFLLLCSRQICVAFSPKLKSPLPPDPAVHYLVCSQQTLFCTAEVPFHLCSLLLQSLYTGKENSLDDHTLMRE